jgi:hypothetical protein
VIKVEEERAPKGFRREVSRQVQLRDIPNGNATTKAPISAPFLAGQWEGSFTQATGSPLSAALGHHTQQREQELFDQLIGGNQAQDT